MATHDDRDVALAYAANPTPAIDLPNRTSPRGSLVAAGPTAAAVTVPPAKRIAVVPGERIDDPWLRSIVMAPSVQDTMRVTVLGPTDYRTLQPFIAKPHTAVAIGFSDDPHGGLTSHAFEGPAVAFLPTVTFMPLRAAALN